MEHFLAIFFRCSILSNVAKYSESIPVMSSFQDNGYVTERIFLLFFWLLLLINTLAFIVLFNLFCLQLCHMELNDLDPIICYKIKSLKKFQNLFHSPSGQDVLSSP